MPATLENIKRKTRRLTRSLTFAQLSDSDLTDYINDFILYDMPEHLRLFTLRRVFTFYVEPNKDVYRNNDSPELTDFINSIITIHDPAYVAGRRVFLTQSRDQFFNIYPPTQSIINIATGNNVTTNFIGTIQNRPFLRNQVTIASIDGNENGLVLRDDGQGNFTGDGVGTVNYLTGAFNVTFNVAPGADKNVTAHVFTYTASRPNSILYFNNEFTFRPVPDQPYRVDLEAYVRPSELLNNNDEPELEQWWQYIAYGAAKKIFEDRSDMDSVAAIMPEFKEQETLVLRRTIVQMTKERAATIYTEGSPDYWQGFFDPSSF